MAKKVLILSSTPRKGGNSDRLCDEFYGVGAWKIGEIEGKPSMAEAYDMGCKA